MANLPLESFAFSSCCEDTTELCDSEKSSSDESEKDGCCEDSSCQCQCCHINNFYNSEKTIQTSLPTVFIESMFTYEFLYSMESYTSLFKPPLV